MYMYVCMYVCIGTSGVTHVHVHVLARCRTKAAPKIAGSYSYITALQFHCCMPFVALEAKVFMKHTCTHAHVSSATCSSFFCLQAANQRQSATMPSCKGGLACCIEPCSLHYFLRLASLGGGPQAHVHMKGMKCRVLYLNVLGMNALFL